MALSVLVEWIQSSMHTSSLIASTSGPYKLENHERPSSVLDGNTEIENGLHGGPRYTIAELKEMETDAKEDQLLFDSSLLPEYLRRGAPMDNMDTEVL